MSAAPTSGPYYDILALRHPTWSPGDCLEQLRELRAQGVGEETALRTAIQKGADTAKLGVEIVFVGLQDIHPPTGTKEITVAAAYEKLIGAEQDRATAILAAEGDARRTVLGAEAESVRTATDEKNAGWIYVTHGVMPNPWDRPPEPEMYDWRGLERRRVITRT